MEDVLSLIRAERARQDARYGPVGSRPHGLGVWLAVLMEEVGEVARAHLESLNFNGTDRVVSDAERERIKSECVQVAAVAVAMIEWLDARGPETAPGIVAARPVLFLEDR